MSDAHGLVGLQAYEATAPPADTSTLYRHATEPRAFEDGQNLLYNDEEDLTNGERPSGDIEDGLPSDNKDDPPSVIEDDLPSVDEENVSSSNKEGLSPDDAGY